jgi:hypothetical protein
MLQHLFNKVARISLSRGPENTSASAPQQPRVVVDVELQQPSSAAAGPAAQVKGGAGSAAEVGPLVEAAADTVNTVDIDPLSDGVVQQLDRASLSSDFVFGPLPGDLAQQPQTYAGK